MGVPLQDALCESRGRQVGKGLPARGRAGA